MIVAMEFAELAGRMPPVMKRHIIQLLLLRTAPSHSRSGGNYLDDIGYRTLENEHVLISRGPTSKWAGWKRQ